MGKGPPRLQHLALPVPNPSCPCTRPTWVGYEWMSTLMALRLMMLKGLSM